MKNRHELEQRFRQLDRADRAWITEAYRAEGAPDWLVWLAGVLGLAAVTTHVCLRDE